MKVEDYVGAEKILHGVNNEGLQNRLTQTAFLLLDTKDRVHIYNPG